MQETCFGGASNARFTKRSSPINLETGTQVGTIDYQSSLYTQRLGGNFIGTAVGTFPKLAADLKLPDGYITMDVTGPTYLVITGDCGYGKASLVSQWTEEHRSADICWANSQVGDISDSPRWFARRRDLVGDFVNRASQLEKDGFPDSALDLVYDCIDELLWNADFATCTSILGYINVSAYSSDILLALLTTTRPAKSHIPSRVRFLQRVESELLSRGEDESRLLAGLR